MTSFSYYAILLGITGFAGDAYTNSAIFASVEILADISAAFVINRFGRKCGIFYNFIVGAAACLASEFIDSIIC